MTGQDHAEKINRWAHSIGGRTNEDAEMAAATLALRSALQRLRRACGDDRADFDRRVANETESVR